MKLARHQQILSLLADSGRQAVAHLSPQLGVSEMTLRRDLEELEDRGLLRRVHGGAVLTGETDPGYWLRHRQSQEQKRQIGKQAASLVEAETTVYLDTGTTATEVARALASRAVKEGLRLSVATHSLNVALELTSSPSVKVHLIGGAVSSETLGTYGPGAVAEIGRLNIDMCFVGVTGVDIDAGFTNSSAVGIEVKQALLLRARKSYVVADTSKWRKSSMLRVCEMKEVAGWITDDRLPVADRRRIQRAGVAVITGQAGA